MVEPKDKYDVFEVSQTSMPVFFDKQSSLIFPYAGYGEQIAHRFYDVKLIERGEKMDDLLQVYAKSGMMVHQGERLTIGSHGDYLCVLLRDPDLCVFLPVEFSLGVITNARPTFVLQKGSSIPFAVVHISEAVSYLAGRKLRGTIFEIQDGVMLSLPTEAGMIKMGMIGWSIPVVCSNKSQLSKTDVFSLYCSLKSTHQGPSLW